MIENRLISLLRKSKSLAQNISPSSSTRCSTISPYFGPQSTFYSSFSKIGALVSRNSHGCCFRSLLQNDIKNFRRLRNFSTAASIASKNAEGVKLLVTAGPKAQRAVAIWLFESAAWVFSMVVLGGVTRLTRSGLSMTDLKFAGGLPPLTDDEWSLEFENYKQSPEYKR